MKKAIIVLILASLVAGGVFAQKVGDIVQVSGQTFRVTEYSGGRLVMQLVSLDGVWQLASGRNVHTINGNTGVWTQIGPESQAAERNGHVKVGDLWLRNIIKTDDLTWTCQSLNVSANGATWVDCIITMAADGKTFRMKATTGSGNWSFTRKQ